MGRTLSLADIESIPRHGFLDEPTPITALPRMAAALGLASLSVKRDDLLGALHGGSKPRKLDYVLAAPPFSEAKAWAAVGGIGSGNVAAATAAAKEMGRELHAHLFWTDVSAGVLEKLAFTASGARSITFYRSTTEMALRRPSLVIGTPTLPTPHLPPGSTTGLAMVGLVRAALELRAQVEAGELPAPERVYLAFGSGGLAAGLSVGLAIAGIEAEVFSVAVVARALSTRMRARSLQRAALAELERAGLRDLPRPVPLHVDHGHLGGGYAVPTPESIAAVEALALEGVPLEPVYTGKTMAALFADAARKKVGHVLLWQTTARTPLPHDEDWRDRLPPALRKRLAHTAGVAAGRRRTMVALGLGAAAAIAGVRLTGYRAWPGVSGYVLSSTEADILHSVAEALLPEEARGPALDAIPGRVDRYLRGMPPSVQRDIHGMLSLLEHGTLALGAHLHRMSALSPSERAAYLEGLSARGGLLAQAYRGVRDLVFLGYYQDPSTWGALGYEGPRVSLSYNPSGSDRLRFPAYDDLVAPEGALPRGAVR